MGFSKKRVVISLIISIVIWLITVFIQAVNEAPRYVAMLSQSDCPATGYPLTQCIKNIPNILVYGINIFFWFWVIHFFYGFFTRKRNP